MLRLLCDSMQAGLARRHRECVGCSLHCYCTPVLQRKTNLDQHGLRVPDVWASTLCRVITGQRLGKNLSGLQKRRMANLLLAHVQKTTIMKDAARIHGSDPLRVAPGAVLTHLLAVLAFAVVWDGEPRPNTAVVGALSKLLATVETHGALTANLLPRPTVALVLPADVQAVAVLPESSIHVHLPIAHKAVAVALGCALRADKRHVPQRVPDVPAVQLPGLRCRVDAVHVQGGLALRGTRRGRVVVRAGV
mmetsp:Transcript_31322/g.75032  ORF Transcript_31322/g.75032 Transcript_31322/m.75032 type:complete len:249 (+) Transcript_31322:32-778(+)